jgi:hypothetical protein
MKKFLICMVVACCFVAPAGAQSLLDALKSVASNVADQVTGGKATETLMVGTWNYTQPGVKLQSDNTLADLGASALTTNLETRLAKLYTIVGIKKGVCTFTFSSDKSFTATIGSRKFQGTYEFTADTHDVTLSFETTSNYNIGTLTGKAYLSGTDLQLLFPATRLLSMVNTLGSKLATYSTTAATVSTLVGNFDNLYLGFEFSK